MFKVQMVCCALFLCCSAAFSQVVTFEDRDVETAVRRALHKSTGDISLAEMETISELSVSLGNLDHSLTQLALCTSLRRLVCELVGDSSPLPPSDGQIEARIGDISALESLRELWLAGSSLSGGCGGYGYAVMGESVDISPIAALDNLECLMLFINAASLAPLQSLHSLKTFISPASTAEEVAAVAGLSQVEVLKLPYLDWSSPEQSAPLAEMAGLRDLMIERIVPFNGNGLTPLPQVEALHVCTAGQWNNPFGHGISITADFVRTFPSLTSLTLGRPCYDENYCILAGYTALSSLPHLERFIHYGPPAIDLSFVAGLPNLAEVSLIDGLDNQDRDGGQDFAPLVDVLAQSPRPFRLQVVNSCVTSAACAEQIPALFEMPDVIVETSGLYYAPLGNMLPCTLGVHARIETPAVFENMHEAGQDIVLTANFQGGGMKESLEYQWYKDDAELTGEELATLIIDNAQVSDSGVYVCTVTWPGGSMSTEPVTVNVVAVVSAAAPLALLALTACLATAIRKRLD